MATSSNAQFRVENGLYVQGTANVSGTLRVEGDLSVNGNLLTALNLAGDIKPTTNNTLNLGSADMRWGLYANTADLTGTLTVSGNTTLANTTTDNILPSSNNKGLGSATRRWDLFANNANVVTAGVSGNLTVGAVFANQTALYITNGAFSVNTGSKVAILATGNSTYSNLVFTNDLTTLSGNVVFDTDTFVIDAVNNRIGLKTNITSLSTSALATITGNLEFSTISTGVRLQTSNASMNASVMMTGNTTNTRVTFNTFDSGISGTTTGGYVFAGTNATTTQTLLDFNSTTLQYKSGNVAHSGNFGIYDVSGTRLGP